MPQITAIEVQATRKNRRSVFVDQVFCCGVDEEVVQRLHLQVGQEVGPEALRLLLTTGEEVRLREKILRLLDRHAYTRRQLEDKFRQRGADPGVVAVVLDRLQASGLINDEAYARAWIQTHSHQGAMGRRRLAAEMARRGIDRTTTEVVLAEEAPADEPGACEELALRKAAVYRNLPRETARQRLSGFLIRRGFNFEDVRRAVDKALPAEA